MSVAARVLGWISDLSALGSESLDAVAAHRFTKSRPLTYTEADALYHGDWAAARIVDALPNEAFRVPIRVPISGDKGAELGSLVSDELRRIGVQERFHQTSRWGRCHGGSAVFLGVDDGDTPLKDPLDKTKVRAVEYLDTVYREELTPVSWYGGREINPRDRMVSTMRRSVFASAGNVTELRPERLEARAREKAGEPEVWRWTRDGRSLEVHESRLLMFGGAPTSRHERIANNWFDHSVLQKCLPVLKQCAHNWQAVGQILSTAHLKTLGVKDIDAVVAEGGKTGLQNRLEQIRLAILMGIIPYDAEHESVDIKTISLGGLTDIVHDNWQVLCAAEGIPVTVFMGLSPAGLNATGAAGEGIRTWYDRTRTYQIMVVKPLVEVVLELLFMAKAGPFRGQEPEQWDVDFGTLWQRNETEEAAYRKQVADTDAIYVGMAPVLTEPFLKSRFRPEGYSAETNIDWQAYDAEKAKREAEDEARAKGEADDGQSAEDDEQAEKDAERFRQIRARRSAA